MDVNKSKSPQKAAARPPTDGAKYRVVGLSFFAYGRIYKPNEELFYDGVPGAALIPINDEAREKISAKTVKLEKAKPLSLKK